MGSLLTQPSALKNILTPSSIININSSVKAANQPLVQTWTAFTDAYSVAKGTDGYTLCGPRTYTFSPSYSWLTISTPAATPDVNTISVNSQSNSDIGTWTISVAANLRSTKFSNITATTSFVVQITKCVITSFSAPVIADQTFTVYSGPTYPGSLQSISLSAYTQTPACGYSVTYLPKIQKTAN